MELVPDRTLLYIDNVSFAQEKLKDETKKLVILHFVLRPFTYDQAVLMGVANRLFDFDRIEGTDKPEPLPLDDVESISVRLKALPIFNLAWTRGQDTEGVFKVPDVKVNPLITFKRHKEAAGVFSARFTASVVYPSAMDLLEICHAYTESRYVTFEPGQMPLPIDGEIVPLDQPVQRALDA